MKINAFVAMTSKRQNTLSMRNERLFELELTVAMVSFIVVPIFFVELKDQLTTQFTLQTFKYQLQSLDYVGNPKQTCIFYAIDLKASVGYMTMKGNFTTAGTF